MLRGDHKVQRCLQIAHSVRDETAPENLNLVLCTQKMQRLFGAHRSSVRIRERAVYL